MSVMWGLVSDVHGNLTALEEALDVLHGLGATRLAFLGDYLGRGDSDVGHHGLFGDGAFRHVLWLYTPYGHPGQP